MYLLYLLPCIQLEILICRYIGTSWVSLFFFFFVIVELFMMLIPLQWHLLSGVSTDVFSQDLFYKNVKVEQLVFF